jgi:hypothetical protein
VDQKQDNTVVSSFAGTKRKETDLINRIAVVLDSSTVSISSDSVLCVCVDYTVQPTVLEELRVYN